MKVLNTIRYNSKFTHTILIIMLSVISIVSFSDSAEANRQLQALSSGSVVQLEGTPHLWVMSEGVLHWAGDTRALENRYVNWSDRKLVSLSSLKTLKIGDPWLSSGLVKSGDPIYLPKWETNQRVPILLQVQSIDDVEIFGINSNNYGSVINEARKWETKTGFVIAELNTGTLARAAMPTVTPTAIPSPTSAGMSAQYCLALSVSIFSNMDSIIDSQQRANEVALAYGQRQSSSSFLRGATQVQGGVSSATVQKGSQQLYDSIPGKQGDSFTVRMARQAGYIDIEDVIQNFNQRSINQLEELGCSLRR